MKVKYKNKNYLVSTYDNSVWQVYNTDKPNRLLDQRSKIVIAIKRRSALVKEYNSNNSW